MGDLRRKLLVGACGTENWNDDHSSFQYHTSDVQIAMRQKKGWHKSPWGVYVPPGEVVTSNTNFKIWVGSVGADGHYW